MGADKSLTGTGKKQANVSVRMAWISFGALPCRKINLMTARVSMFFEVARFAWHASELGSFLVGLSTYQHPGTTSVLRTELWEPAYYRPINRGRHMSDITSLRLSPEAHIYFCLQSVTSETVLFSKRKKKNVLNINWIFFNVWLTVHRSSMWVKRPTRCHF